MTELGFLRIATASPRLQLANPAANAKATIDMLDRAEAFGVGVIVFPEMGLTGYTCNDLFFQHSLLDTAMEALQKVVKSTEEGFGGLAVVGLPAMIDDQIFNCAAVISGGKLLGLIPKSYLPTYKEFYDARFFAPSFTAISKSILLPWYDWAGKAVYVPFGTDLLFEANIVKGLVVGVEICEDLWAPLPPSSLQALNGATVLLNLSASNESIGKAAYRRQLIASQSGRCIAAYAYAGAGMGESTTDLVFGGHSLIAENGSVLAESTRFERNGSLTMADVDLDRLRIYRCQTTSFSDGLLAKGLRQEYRRIGFELQERNMGDELLREVEAHPFVPANTSELRTRCEEIFLTQVTGLARRLEVVPGTPLAIGVSGGLDSTLALLVLCKTLDSTKQSRSRIRALTMPGFGTTSRTLANARGLMSALGITFHEIDIRPLCLAEMHALNHKPFGISLEDMDVESFTAKLRNLSSEKCNDLVFENVQARMRTQLLMNSGFVIGTGDLSELALGWCTYNGDHMSMYNPNISIPKTLVKFLVKWVAEHEFEGEAQRILLDIVATEISPELLPSGLDGKLQSTEATIGPYELHDFFLYHYLRFGTPPSKILFLAQRAKFDRPYTEGELRQWLRLFLQRFFANQFKRSCLPDGPKVGSVTLSPRGDWRMPSDAQVTAWLADMD